MEAYSSEREVVAWWIKALPDFEPTAEWISQRDALTRELLMRLKALASANRMRWKRYHYWRKWLRYLLDATS